MKRLVGQLVNEHRLDAAGYHALISSCDDALLDMLRREAVRTTVERFGHGIYLRGLIEISSYCRNDCLYCGLRCGNREAVRYRLDDAAILDRCACGYEAGLRTFVLQGGEDPAMTDDRLVSLVSEIHARWADAAITLSLGERPRESYKALFDAGASRYLLRHEAADAALYRSLHPSWMTLENRVKCIENLIAIGYQTGMGMIVGVPGQSVGSLVDDLMLMQRIAPHMVGIGPFIPHHGTPLAGHPAGSLRMTLLLLAIVRLMLPDALIPATTALATLSPLGRREGILSGANVVMPNLSPAAVRDKYEIYDNKLSSGTEAVESIPLLARELESIGRHISFSRGDYRKNENL